MIPMPLTSSQSNQPAAVESSGDANPGYSGRKSNYYDYIDDGDYEQPVCYEPLVDHPEGRPPDSSHGYDQLGPDYLRIIG